jgi:hypothetical protein
MIRPPTRIIAGLTPAEPANTNEKFRTVPRKGHDPDEQAQDQADPDHDLADGHQRAEEAMAGVAQPLQPVDVPEGDVGWSPAVPLARARLANPATASPTWRVRVPSGVLTVPERIQPMLPSPVRR